MSGLEIALAALKGAGQVVSLAAAVYKVIKGIKEFFEKEKEHREISAKISDKLIGLSMVPDFLKVAEFGGDKLFHDMSVQRFKSAIIVCAEKCIELGKLGWFEIRLPRVKKTLIELDDLLSNAVEVYQLQLVGVITKSVQSMSEKMNSVAKEMSEMKEMMKKILDRLFQEETRKARDIMARHSRELETSRLVPPKYVDLDKRSLKEVITSLNETVRFNEAALKLTEPDSTTWKDEHMKLVKWNDEIMPKLTKWEDDKLAHMREIMSDFASLGDERVPKPTGEDVSMDVPITKHEEMLTSTLTMSNPV